MYNWKKDIAQWTIDDKLFLSVVFTWDLERAKEIAQNSKKKYVFAGGPAVSLMPDYLSGIAWTEREAEPIFKPIQFHNPLATFTTRGCPNQCSFCAVPFIEGDLKELSSWEPKPLICDNNLLASSKGHFNRVIDSLKQIPFVDFNQGLEAALFTEHHAHRMQELKSVKIRFAFDSIASESKLMDAIKLARLHGFNDFGVYVLINHNDSPEDAIYRLELIRSMNILPNPMRFQPLYSVQKNSFIENGWTEYMLQKVMRYYSRLIHLGHIPFDEFEPNLSYKQENLF